MTKDIIKSTLKTLAPVSWVKPAVCPAGEWLELQHRERPTETWCPPAPGACLWVACGGLWAGGVCTELRCSPSSLDRSGWAWLCQSWCCSRSVLPPVCTSNHKYSSVKAARSSPHRSCFSECAHTHTFSPLSWHQFQNHCHWPALLLQSHHYCKTKNINYTKHTSV